MHALGVGDCAPDCDMREGARTASAAAAPYYLLIGASGKLAQQLIFPWPQFHETIAFAFKTHTFNSTAIHSNFKTRLSSICQPFSHKKIQPTSHSIYIYMQKILLTNLIFSLDTIVFENFWETKLVNWVEIGDSFYETETNGQNYIAAKIKFCWYLLGLTVTIFITCSVKKQNFIKMQKESAKSEFCGDIWCDQ